MEKFQKLNNKVAVITGGANGLGQATAQLFAENGAKIVVADINKTAGSQVVADIKDSSGSAIFTNTNVADSASIDSMITQTINHFGQIDIMINNAGILADARLVNMTMEEWERVININLKGVFLGGQAAAKAMIDQDHGGVILNTSSVVGLYGNFGQSNYVASKAGVIGLTKTWARELGKYNIRVNAVAPGFIATDIIKVMPQKIIDMMKAKTLLKRLGKPEDIAKAFLYLASDDADYVTGTVLQVDGGIVI